MNVAYNEINCADAAKMIGVDKSTVSAWCRKQIINCVNLSNGNKNGRYLIAEKEVEYLRKLKKDYGSMRQAMMHYRKDWEDTDKKEEYPTVKAVVTNITVEDVPTRKDFDMDKITATISYIQDIKERLNDIEAEKNQLQNELEELRKEVMEYL